jgi:hypothetical protein
MIISYDCAYHGERVVVHRSGLRGFAEYTCTNCIDVKSACYGCHSKRTMQPL